MDNQFTENEVKELIVIQTQDTIELFNNHFSDHQIPFEKLTIQFNLTGKVAGRGFFYKPKLRYNLQLAKENLNDFLENTVPHEIIHLYQRKIYPNCKSHGKEFYFIGKTLGYNLKRTHSYKTESARKRIKYLYTCDCGGKYWITKKMHDRVQIYKKGYCRKCRSKLVFQDKIEKR